ncbi:extracellular solute-binding protein [Microbacterium sp. CFH 90308]|uniref:Extracellular solute-binding protein n=1 Tax=Microbacterium salsuginis TaxID=2722803 RepID=A0ABX1K8X8_9MICO|nr:extracellular solute-binding protein [Microbacterium sp. CFH 90308]NLP82433.1 extracellular solute-binding protein [Microbacterium sp. CFH 90308]
MTRHTTRALLGTGALLLTGALALTACGSGFTDDTAGGGDGELTSSDDALSVLIGSSGEAETAAVEEAVAAWSEESGIDAEVQVANDLPQQLSQGFAAGSPPDVFYLATEALAGYAGNGSILPYGDLLENKDDFYPSLVENFTFEDEFYCAPKDFSTLQLIINKGLWDAAGLTDADIPTTWDQLAEVAATLTTGGVTGLAFGPEYQRIGAFMAQAGGQLVSDDGTQAVANSSENVEALTYVQEQMNAGSFAYSSDLGAGWGGEAFGKQLSAMTIEGNWITGAMTNDFPDVEYVVAELPEGPAGQGTMQFTNCWGMAADSPNQQGALELIEYLTSAEQQLAFSEAFGPMPSVESAAEQWTSDNPELAPFLAGADYAQGVPTNDGIAAVITDFNAQLEGLKTGDPQQILDTVQSNVESVVG